MSDNISHQRPKAYLQSYVCTLIIVEEYVKKLHFHSSQLLYIYMK